MRSRLYVVFCGHPGPLEANGMGTTCMELEGHDGPHEYVPNDAITATYRHPRSPTAQEDR